MYLAGPAKVLEFSCSYSRRDALGLVLLICAHTAQCASRSVVVALLFLLVAPLNGCDAPIWIMTLSIGVLARHQPA
jgi:hypothetical protein